MPAVSPPTFAQNAKMGHPRFGFGGKEPGAEIPSAGSGQALRWESPALPETPPPQDDSGVGHSFVYLLSLGGGT